MYHSSGGERSSRCKKKTANVALALPAIGMLQDKSSIVSMRKWPHWPSTYNILGYSRHCSKPSSENFKMARVYTSRLKGLSSEIYLAANSINRQVTLKRDAPRSSAGFAHPLSCERPFKCWHHLKQNLRIIFLKFRSPVSPVIVKAFSTVHF